MSVAAMILLAAMAAAPEQATTAKPEEKKICKRVFDADTGSNMRTSKRVCGTALEWQLQEEETRRSVGTIRSKGYIAQPQPGMGSPQ
jgi:hypothetical protein